MEHKKNSGFTLTELTVSLIIISLIMGLFMSAGSAYIANQNTKITQNRLQVIDSALVTFVAVQGRLPCPANGSLNVGTEDRNGASSSCNNSQTNGVVPWVTLGLPEAETVDAWNNRIMYRVGNNLVADGAVDMSNCDPAGTAGTTADKCIVVCSSTTCTSPLNFLQGKGLTIKVDSATATNVMDPAATPPTGAAFVLISHGANGAGSFPMGGGPVRDATTAGANEQVNQNGSALKSTYIDANYNEDSGTAHFDDLVLRPSLSTIIMKAQRGARIR